MKDKLLELLASIIMSATALCVGSIIGFFTAHIPVVTPIFYLLIIMTALIWAGIRAEERGL